MKTFKMASAAKKSARIVKITAAVASVAASMNLSAEDEHAMQCAFEDMAAEYGKALIIPMEPFRGFCA